MNKSATTWQLLTTMTITVSIGGCASAYRCYSGCDIDCDYCPPSPLPYTRYDDRACHSQAAQSYLHLTPTPTIVESAVNIVPQRITR